MFFLYSKVSRLIFKINLGPLLKFYALTMLMNICLRSFSLFLVHRVSSIKHLVLTHLNRHLVETARTLLLHQNVPLRLWGDVILTACHLINRMPSSILNNEVPHSLISHTRSLLHSSSCPWLYMFCL